MSSKKTGGQFHPVGLGRAGQVATKTKPFFFPKRQPSKETAKAQQKQNIFFKTAALPKKQPTKNLRLDPLRQITQTIPDPRRTGLKHDRGLPTFAPATSNFKQGYRKFTMNSQACCKSTEVGAPGGRSPRAPQGQSPLEEVGDSPFGPYYLQHSGSSPLGGLGGMGPQWDTVCKEGPFPPQPGSAQGGQWGGQ